MIDRHFHRIRVSLALAVALLACACGEPEPPRDDVAYWLAEVHRPILELETLTPRIEVRPAGVFEVAAIGQRTPVPRGGWDAAIGRARVDDVLLLAVDGRLRQTAEVWALTGAAFALGVRRVRYALVLEGYTGYVEVLPVPVRRRAVTEDWSTLDLGIAVTSAGIRVFGSGGNLASTCDATQPTGRRDPTIAGHDWHRLPRCLARIKRVFPDETFATFYFGGDVPFARAARLLVLTRFDGTDELFPDLLFDPLPPDRAEPSGL